MAPNDTLMLECTIIVVSSFCLYMDCIQCTCRDDKNVSKPFIILIDTGLQRILIHIYMCTCTVTSPNGHSMTNGPKRTNSYFHNKLGISKERTISIERQDAWYTYTCTYVLV